MKKFKNGAAGLLVVCMLVLMGCGGGGSDTPSNDNSNSYIGFDAADFSNKNIYLVELNQWSKGAFLPNGDMEGFLPNSTTDYQEFTWSIVAGKLVVTRVYTPHDETTYTLLSDDTVNRYMRTSQQWADGTTHTIGMFYDQATGGSQAQDFVVNHRIP